MIYTDATKMFRVPTTNKLVANKGNKAKHGI